MATTKRRTSRSTTKTTRSTPSRTQPQSLAERTGKAIQNRPATTAAIVTGVVSGIAAAVAGFLAFKKSGKSFPEFRDDVTADIKRGAADAKAKIKDGIADAKTKAKEWSEPLKDGIDAERSQSEIAEEAMSIKQTGKKANRPVDDTVDQEIKTGAISY